jgi:hypothetical protein
VDIEVLFAREEWCDFTLGLVGQASGLSGAASRHCPAASRGKDLQQDTKLLVGLHETSGQDWKKSQGQAMEPLHMKHPRGLLQRVAAVDHGGSSASHSS